MSATANRAFDISASSTVLTNPPVELLIQHCLDDGDLMADNGAVVAYTGKYTGRTPKDKFFVREPSSESKINWGPNQPMDQAQFERVRRVISDYIVGKRLYVIDAYGGADPKYRIAVRFIVERPYHALFIKQLLIRPSAEELASFVPEWTIVDMGKHSMDPVKDGTRADAVNALHLGEKLILIAGTQYAGEMKKTVFSLMNYLLPGQGVMSMHCSANIGERGDTALFFGLSGTGKTTLSASPDRRLIGDDEHGWSDQGVFNIEGGCYAKCIDLSREREPQIYEAIRRGAVLENVVLHEGHPDYSDASLTENTRAAYPLDFVTNAVSPSVGGHPENVFFLTCDALGVLPPIARLDPEQVMFYFLNGYTAKVAGTEAGVTEPSVVFSTCFGAPFMPLKPKLYAELLRDKVGRHGSRVWLVNTGWSGGPYGVGSRIPLKYTRQLLHNCFAGSLNDVPYDVDPIFGLNIPRECAGVPSELLHPKETWPDREAYAEKAAQLFAMFQANHRQYA